MTLTDPPETHIGDNIYISVDGDILRIEAFHEDGSDIIYLNENNYIALVEFINAKQTKDSTNGTV